MDDQRRGARIVAAAIVAYVAVFSLLGRWRVEVSPHNNVDTAIFFQSLYTTTFYGLPLANSIEPQGTHFAVHFTPTFYLLLPWVALWPSVLGMPVLQSVALALGAWPLYRLASRHLGGRPGAAVAVLYLLYHPLHGVNWDNWSENALMPLPLLAAIEAMDRRAWIPFWLWSVAAMGAKEDAALMVAGLGLYMLLVRRERVHGLLAAAVGTLWFLVVVAFFLPGTNSGQVSYFGVYFGHLGATPAQALWRVASDPIFVLRHVATLPNLLYVVEMVLPLAFLPWLEWPLLLAALPTWAANLLSQHHNTHVVGTRYVAALIPFVQAAGVFALARLGERTRLQWLRAAAVMTVLGTLLLNPSPLRIPWHLEPPSAHSRARVALASTIPESLSVAAPVGFAPFICARRQWWYLPAPEADVTLVDTTQPDYVQDGWDRMVASGRWIRDREEAGVVVYLRRGQRIARQ